MSITATKKKTQCEALASYLKKHRSKGITTLEAAIVLGICCLHKRIADLEEDGSYYNYKRNATPLVITRTPERTDSGARIIRYKLAR